MTMTNPLPVTVAIQAGGQSRRMGSNKAFVDVNGRTMIELVIERVRGLGTELLLVANDTEAFAHLGLPTFPDVYPGCGPLAGIYTAVAHAGQPHTLVVACDMPYLQRPLLRHLLLLRATADAVVPRWGTHPEPLHAVYSKACLPAMERRLQAGWLKVADFLAEVSVRYVEREEIARFDGDGRSFTNVNTPADLQALREQF